MSKKDYEKVAAMLREMYGVRLEDRSDDWMNAYWTCLGDVVDNLAYVFKLDNPRFDAGRFMDAVLPESLGGLTDAS